MDHTRNSSTSSPLEALEYPYQVFLIGLYSLTACFAFVSNLLTIVVLVQGKRCTRDLRKFLINLSVTDLLLAIFTIPFTYTNYMLGRWIFLPVMCSIVNFAQLTTITVSIYTLVAIAIDRYFAIMHPLKKSISWFKTHRTQVVLMMWILGITIGFSQLIVSQTKTFVHEGLVYTECGEKLVPGSVSGQMYTLFIFLVTFALPMTTLCIVYTAMGCHLFSYKMPGTEQNHHQWPKHTEILKAKRNIRCNPFQKRNGKFEPNLSETIATRCQTDSNHQARQFKSKSIRVSSNSSVNNESVNKLQILYMSASDTQRPIVTKHNYRMRQENQCSKPSHLNSHGHSPNGLYLVGDIPMLNGNQKQANNNCDNMCAINRNINTTREHHSTLVGPSPVATPLTSPIVQRRYSLRENASYRIKSKQHNLESIQHKTLKIIYIRRNRVLKMLITIISVFTVCWLPIQIFTMLIYFRPSYLQVDSRQSLKYYTFVGTYFCCHWIAMAHSFMNPIIYSFMSKNFKDDVRHIFTRFWNKYVLRTSFRASYSSYHHPLFAHYKPSSGLRRAGSNNFVTTTNESTEPQIQSDLDYRQATKIQSPLAYSAPNPPLCHCLVENKHSATIASKPNNNKNRTSKIVSKLRRNKSASNLEKHQQPNQRHRGSLTIGTRFTSQKKCNLNKSFSTTIQTSSKPFGLQLDQCLQNVKSSTII